MARGDRYLKTRCECGRRITEKVRPTCVKSGCERCNAIEGRTGYLRESVGERREDVNLYGTRAAVARACRKFWEKRGLPEPGVDFYTPGWLSDL